MRRIAAGLGALALLWGGGFGWFLRETAREAALPAHADGIVALTGGAGRVEAALHLLADGRADRLLISGVGGAAEFGALAQRANVTAAAITAAPITAALAPRVTLGRAATSTRGNAAEAAEWSRANRVGSLIVVTAAFHMPRAMAEFSRAMPNVALHPAPVRAGSQRDDAGLRVLAGEYSKFLAAEAGLSAFVSRADERSAARTHPTQPNTERGGG
ncbi:MAG: YdcF family protein [Alphaproteobacteria bacterium]|nr:YdcF family protein [Alphaproteobacteria bacterium]